MTNLKPHAPFIILHDSGATYIPWFDRERAERIATMPGRRFMRDDERRAYFPNHYA